MRLAICMFALTLAGGCAHRPDAVDAMPARGSVPGAVEEAAVTEVVPARQVDQPSLQQLIRARIGAVRGCYEEALKVVPTLKGKVVVRFQILFDGGLASVAVKSSSMQTPAVGECIVKVMESWTTDFRPDAPVYVEYPFVFAPAR